MDKTAQKQIKTLSFLLQFPDKDTLESLREATTETEQVFAEPGRVHVRKFLQYLTETPNLAVQEAFCAAFDLNPDTCMNLTWHEYKDGAKRGPALARFARAFDDAGFAPVCRDLPDYLPMVLELMSQGTNGELQWIVADHGQTVKMLTERLRSMQSPYTTVFQVLTETLEFCANQHKKGA
ncbi:MAG: nitrate reductase molybdenum cofactor assembly chaperone [Desulfobacterales bacterium]|nr:nitrate reductase molybdenum cofactor assembly chaperone [Desulfobacterales bacterium]